ncbi:MAG TPA: Tm-1-like ATP-binding domain-containing protein, partial [Pirellulales bacterium]
MAVFLFAALDTKGAEADFLREQLQALGVACVVVDVSCGPVGSATADIPREAVFQAAGFAADVLAAGDRAAAVDAAAAGAARLAAERFARKELSGIVA